MSAILKLLIAARDAVTLSDYDVFGWQLRHSNNDVRARSKENCTEYLHERSFPGGLDSVRRLGAYT
jgi:hypothetical protein